MGRPTGSRNKVQKTHCKRGHTLTPENRDKRGKCLACGHTRSLNWYYKNLSASKGYNKDWSSKNKAKRSTTALQKGRKATGWTEERISQFTLLQKNSCAVCGVAFTHTPSADHEHSEPPKPRGLLCRLCNLAIGLLRDSPELCESAARYLTLWRENEIP